MSEGYQVPKLGRLRSVDLREVWNSEPYAFTPWLAQAENLQFLAETIGLPALELVTTEHAVDIFSADIVAKAPDTGQTVLIENQIERTDHTHLGQVLTYAAGLEAAIIVWVAKRFTEGHRAALDWLNRITSEDFAFFGLEVEALRIGDSEPAPRFNVVARPNEWSRQLKAASVQAESSPQAMSHAAFWAGYEDAARKIDAPLRVAAKPVTSTNYYVRVGTRGMTYLCAYRALSTKKQGVYVSIQGEHAAAVYDALRARKAEIEAAYGAPLDWQTDREGRLYSILGGTSPASTDESAWSEQQLWLAERMKRLREAVTPVVWVAQNEPTLG
jgi:hypothetical protein